MRLVPRGTARRRSGRPFAAPLPFVLRFLLPLTLLLVLLPGGFVRAEEEKDAPPVAALPSPPDAADAYRTSAEAAAWLRRLEARFQEKGIAARRLRYGTSAGGRPLEALRIGRAAPVVLVHGGLGRRDAAGTVACLALGAALARAETAPPVSVLLVPAPNPDALDRFLGGAWPYGGVGVDRDRDGRAGEDGPADADGDGRVLRMRWKDARGAWVEAPAVPGREGPARGMVQRGEDVRRAVSWNLADEALDADGDGQVGEDPPGVDLARDLAGHWDDQAPWRGDGPYPGTAPASRALMELSFQEVGLVAWIAFESAGPFVLHASEQGKTWELDRGLYQDLGRAVARAVDRPLRRAGDLLGREQNPGSDLDWAAVHLGIPALRIPVWWVEKQEGHDADRPVGDDVDWLLWGDRALGGAGFAEWRPFEHPVLGPVEIGGWLPFTRHEPPADLLPALSDRAAAGARAAFAFHPALGLDVRVETRRPGLYEIVARATNTGRAPTQTEAAARQRRAVGVRLTFAPATGATVLAGPRVFDAGTLAPGGASAPARWLVRRDGPGHLGAVAARHPKAGTATAPAEGR